MWKSCHYQFQFPMGYWSQGRLDIGNTGIGNIFTLATINTASGWSADTLKRRGQAPHAIENMLRNNLV